MATKNKNKRPVHPANRKPAPPAAKPTPAKPTPAAKPAPAPEPDLDDDDDIDGDGDDDGGGDIDGDDGGDSDDAFDNTDAPGLPTSAAAPANGDGARGESTNEKYKKLLRSLPQAKRRGVLIGNLYDRVGRQGIEIASWEGAELQDVRDKLASAQRLLGEARTVLDALPEGYRPHSTRVAGSGGREVKDGDVVRITDKRRGEYEEILSADQMTGMQVKSIRGNRVVVMMKAEDGGDPIQAMFPRGHVCHDDPPVANTGA